MDEKTKDISASRLIALADAENISLDILLERQVIDRQAVIDVAGPLILRHGDRVTMDEVSQRTGYPAIYLLHEWHDICELIVDVYIDVTLANTEQVMAEPPEGKSLIARLREYTARGVDWVLEHEDFYLAVQRCVLKVNPDKQHAYLDLQRRIAGTFRATALDPADDLITSTVEERDDLARALISAFNSDIRDLARTGTAEHITDTIIHHYRTILTGRLLK
ncbi:MAG: hypothetical protein JJ902_04140 [Roseibium sp.]|nr:hypothetical protein [Roseibium sp.]